MNKIEHLFVYGTLAPGQPNEHILREINGQWHRAKVVGTLHEEGWGAEMGFPGIKLSREGSHVEGWVFSSDELGRHWDRLDAFEGEAYQRVLTKVALVDQRSIDAFIYVLA